MNELKRLGRIAEASDATIKCWFILGLPEDVVDRLRATPKVQKLPQETVLEMARALVQMVEAKKEEPPAVAMVAAKESEKEVAAVANMRPKKGCYECGQGHYVRN